MEKTKALLIVNPCAGKNKTRLNTFDIVDTLSKADFDCTVKTTSCSGDATEIVKRDIGDNDIVICCGGDGTLNEVMNGVMALPRRVEIAYIPMGSTNDFANTLGIPTGIAEATETIIERKFNGYDVGQFNNRYFSYIACFGPVTDISYNTSQRFKNLFGHNAYMIKTGLSIFKILSSIKPIRLKLEYDGGVYDDDFYFGAISNTTSVAGFFKYDENDVRLDDGEFEILLVRKLNGPLDVFKMVDRIRHRDYDGESLLYLKTSRARITFEKPQPWSLDGEFGGDVKEVRFAVLSKAIDICTKPNRLFKNDSRVLTEKAEESEDVAEDVTGEASANEGENGEGRLKKLQNILPSRNKDKDADDSSVDETADGEKKLTAKIQSILPLKKDKEKTSDDADENTCETECELENEQ